MNSFQNYIKDMPVVPLIEHVSSADPRGILVNDREYLEIYQVSQPRKCKKKKAHKHPCESPDFIGKCFPFQVITKCNNRWLKLSKGD